MLTLKKATLTYLSDVLQNERGSRKVKAWKKERKGEVLLRAVAEKVGLPVEEVYEKAGTILEERFGLYEGFEEVLKEGAEASNKTRNT